MRRLLAATAALLLVSALLAGCVAGDSDPWAGQRPESLTIATGGTTGIYYGYGLAIADVLSEQYGIDTEVLETGGSLDNLHLVEDGTADVAFSAADAATDAVAGEGDFDEPVDLRTLGRVYDDFAHLVVPADSEIEEIADLDGMRVSVGAQRSGVSLIAGRVLDAAGLSIDDLRVAELGITESIEALEAGRLDAVFWSGGLRTPGIVELSETMPVRLIPLDGVVDSLRSEFGRGYRHGVVPEGVYGMEVDVDTLAVPNFLVVAADLPDGVAHGLLETLFDERAAIAEKVPSAGLLDRSRAIYTEPAELHPGALAYYRESKP